MTGLRSIVFYGVFGVVALLYAAIVLPYVLHNSDFAVRTINFLVSTSPILTGDVAIFGEYTPPILAGLMAAAAPPSKQNTPFFIAIGLAVLCYALYVHLTVFLNSGPGGSFLVIGQDDPAATQKAMIGLVASIRTFCIVVAGGLLGFKANPNT